LQHPFPQGLPSTKEFKYCEQNLNDIIHCPSKPLLTSTTVDAATTAASGRSNHVQFVTRMVKDLELRDTVIVRLLGLSQDLTTTGKGGLLAAAALAAARTKAEGTIHRDDFRLRVQFLDRHGVGVAWLAKATATKVGVLQRMKDLGATNEILELRLGFASQNLLEASCDEAKRTKMQCIKRLIQCTSGSNTTISATVQRTTTSLTHLELVTRLQVRLEGA
jgi:hypothetical protein